jgi:hypothetical protein
MAFEGMEYQSGWRSDDSMQLVVGYALEARGGGLA